jgi:uncharacterized protein
VRDTLRRLTSLLSRIPDTPERVAAAFGLGVFLGFSPFIGLQTVLGIAIALALRLSRVAVVLGTWVNLPWIVPAYYLLATEGGARLLGQAPPSELASQIAALLSSVSLSWGSFTRAVNLLRPVLWPFVVGSTIGAALLGYSGYRVMLMLLRLRRAEAMPEASLDPAPPSGEGPSAQ